MAPPQKLKGRLQSPFSPNRQHDAFSDDSSEIESLLTANSLDRILAQNHCSTPNAFVTSPVQLMEIGSPILGDMHHEETPSGAVTPAGELLFQFQILSPDAVASPNLSLVNDKGNTSNPKQKAAQKAIERAERAALEARKEALKNMYLTKEISKEAIDKALQNSADKAEKKTAKDAAKDAVKRASMELAKKASKEAKAAKLAAIKSAKKAEAKEMKRKEKEAKMRAKKEAANQRALFKTARRAAAKMAEITAQNERPKREKITAGRPKKERPAEVVPPRKDRKKEPKVQKQRRPLLIDPGIESWCITDGVRRSERIRLSYERNGKPNYRV